MTPNAYNQIFHLSNESTLIVSSFLMHLHKKTKTKKLDKNKGILKPSWAFIDNHIKQFAQKKGQFSGVPGICLEFT
jgi:hypothetical protein